MSIAAQTPERPMEPPHNIQAEQALLGALFIDNGTYWRVSEAVTGPDFYEGLHGRIFEAIAKMVQAGRKATPLSLRAAFEQDDPIVADLTVPQYLVRLATNAATSSEAREYSRTVRELALRRGLILLAEDMRDAAVQAEIGDDPRKLIEQAEADLHALTTGQTSDELVTIGQAAERMLVIAAEAYQKGEAVGAVTGLKSVDNLVGTLLPGDLVVAGGATSAGKTAFAQQVCYANAMTGRKVAAISLEMTEEQFTARYLAQLTGVKADDMEAGKFQASDYERLREAGKQLEALPIRISDARRSGPMTVSRIRSRAKRMQRLQGIDMLMIDHLHFIRFDNPRVGQVEGIAQVVSDLKLLAMELGVPVLIPTHLNRDSKSRASKRPLLTDLYGSSAIEKDADLVFFVHREEYWLERDKPSMDDDAAYAEYAAAMGKWRGKAQIILAKRRRGPGVGDCLLKFDGAFTRFSELDQPGPLL